MTKIAKFLPAACMTLAFTATPALAQGGQHMMDDHGQSMMNDGEHGQGMMGDEDHGQSAMGDHDQGMMNDGNHGQGMMGDDDHGMMGNGHGMSGHDGQ